MQLRDQVQSSLGGSYKLESELAGGGMSNVFVAVEHALGRRIVVKVLRADLHEAVSKERFKREIATVARLQHPHIVPLLSAGDDGGMLYYTMPFIEGESLRQRLARDGELTIPDALRTMREVATALAYAHRQGLVHRDIKPENILFSDGAAVVTDFGIAKALIVSRTDGVLHPSTITNFGVALGTPAYMAPEQGAADPQIDHRADLYALGCVAYEMLAGRPPFEERVPQQVMAAHASQTPINIATRRASVPPALASVVMHCLEKRPADRPQSADEILRALQGIVTTPSGTASYTATAASEPSSRVRRVGVVVAAALVGAALGGAVAVAAYRSRDHDTSIASPARHFSIVLPDSAPMAFVAPVSTFGHGQRGLALAPDGSTLAYIAAVRGTSMVYIRAMNEATVRPVAGSEGAFSLCFSPDNKWVAFLSGTTLNKVAIGPPLGRPTSLGVVAEPYTCVWPSDGRITVGSDAGLRSVPEAGGATTSLPFNGSALSSAIGGKWIANGADLLHFVSLVDTTQRFWLTRNGATSDTGRAARSRALQGVSATLAGGSHLVFLRPGGEGVLMAMPFDTSRMRPLGDPVPTIAGVRIESAPFGAGQYSVSDDGTLVYAAGENALLRQIVVRDRAGHDQNLSFPRMDLDYLNVARDGAHLTARVWRLGQLRQMAVFDLAAGTMELLPDSISFAVVDADGKSVLATTATATGPMTLRLTPTGALIDTAFRVGSVRAVSANGKVVLMAGTKNGPGNWAVWRDGRTHAPVRGGGNLSSLSPSGDWMATTENVAGEYQVFVQRTMNPAERYRISTNGGQEPIWSADEKEIVYWMNHTWYSVSVSTRPFAHAPPRVLFTGPYEDVPGYSYGLLPNGRFLLVTGASLNSTTHLEVITNWLGEVARLTTSTKPKVY